MKQSRKDFFKTLFGISSGLAIVKNLPETPQNMQIPAPPVPQFDGGVFIQNPLMYSIHEEELKELKYRKKLAEAGCSNYIGPLPTNWGREV